MKPNIIIYALAGTGKTLTLVEGVHHMRGKPSHSIVPSPQQGKIWEQFGIEPFSSGMCFAAFNVSIKEELQKRIDNSLKCNIVTMHGLGYAAIRHKVGLAGEVCKLNKWKTYRLLEDLHDESIQSLSRRLPGYSIAVKQLVRLSKFTCHVLPTNDELAVLAAHHGVSLGSLGKKIFDTTRIILGKSLDFFTEVDFDDMPWVPVVKKLPLKRYDTLLVDEAQDLNHCQQQLALSSGDRIIVVGDEHQAIYGFAGADVNSMQNIQNAITDANGCVSLPLTISRRCSQAVATEAQRIVHEFEAHPANRDGSVTVSKYLYGIQPGDMVLCRTNAPLISTAFKLIATGTPSRIVGQDIKASILHLIDTLKPTSAADLAKRADKQKKTEVLHLQSQNPVPQTAIIAVIDRFNCIEALCREATSVNNVKNAIENLFASDKTTGCVRLSSIHRAKGLEAPNVYIIRSDLLPHPLAEMDWEKEQETNLKYVAITRAKENLIWVRS